MRLYFQPHLQEKQDEGNTVDPEEHIIPGAIGAICIPICMFIFAWGSRERHVDFFLPNKPEHCSALDHPILSAIHQLRRRNDK